MSVINNCVLNNIYEMVEIIQNTIIHEFKQFIDQQNIAIPEVFMVQFIENYLNRDRIFTSEYVYDWFGRQFYTRYDNFTKALIRILPHSLYKINSSQQKDFNYQSKAKGGRGNRVVYDVSYMGMKMMAIHNDPTTALYYIQLEDLVFRFFENKQSEEIKSFKLTIDSLKQHCVIYRLNVYDVEGKLVEKYYVGSTINKKQRLLAHYYDSSNPHVNELILAGRKVTYTILYSFDYLLKKERDQVEQRYIDKIPKERLLNVKAVYIHPMIEESIVVQEENSVQQVDIQLTTEESKHDVSVNLCEIPTRERNTFEQNVQLLKEYIEVNKKYPNKRDESSKQLGYFLSDIRSKYTNKSLYISKERIEYVDQQIPGFVWNYKRDTFTNKVDELKQFYETNKFWPRRNHGQASPHEKSLGKFISNVRDSYNKKDIEGMRIAYKLDDERLQYLFEMIPDFVFSADKEGQYIEIATELNTYIQEHQRLPRRSGKNRLPDEATLGAFIHNLQQSIKLNRSTLPEIMKTLDKYCPLFDYKQQFKLEEPYQ